MIALVFVTGVTLVITFGHRGLVQMYHLRQERLHLDQENAKLAAENDRLARTIDRLQHDPEFIQDRIRQELNFVKKNEIIFQLPPDQRPHHSAAPSEITGGMPVDEAETGKVETPGKDNWFWSLLEKGRRKLTGLMQRATQG
jgi:cell division protein FtsB